MKNHEYKMLSGLDLAMMEFPEEQFIIQDIVPKGLVIRITSRSGCLWSRTRNSRPSAMR